MLFAAAMVGHTETVRSLVEAGVDVEQADAMGRTPLYAAAQEGHVVALRVLLKAGAEVSHRDRGASVLQLSMTLTPSFVECSHSLSCACVYNRHEMMRRVGDLVVRTLAIGAACLSPSPKRPHRPCCTK